MILFRSTALAMKMNGKVISVSGGGEVTTAQVKSALISAVASGDVNLGSAIGATLAYTYLGAGAAECCFLNQVAYRFLLEL